MLLNNFQVENIFVLTKDLAPGIEFPYQGFLIGLYSIIFAIEPITEPFFTIQQFQILQNINRALQEFFIILGANISQYFGQIRAGQAIQKQILNHKVMFLDIKFARQLVQHSRFNK